MSYTKAPIDSEGNINLKPGTYFIDTFAKDYLKVVPDLTSIGVQQYVTRLITDGRGQVMVEYYIEEDIVIPKSLTGATGYFFIMEVGDTLVSISKALYGYVNIKPEGFWEWLNTISPSTFDAAKAAAEGIEEATDVAADVVEQSVIKGFQVTKPIIYLGAAVLGIFLISRMTRAR